MPYSLVLERASGTHNYSVQRKVEPTHLRVLCSVPVSQAHSNKFRFAALEALCFISLWCLGAQRKGMVIIMDEITTGLDPEVRQNMWQSFDAIRKTGVTIILVSHYLDEVEALADKILYMEKGNQRFWGTQNQFREYVKGCIPQEEWEDGCSLEKLYLKLVPKTQGITMEGIL